MLDDDDDQVGERLVSRLPIIVRRRVGWGDCDPAKVVYTPRFADYAASAFFWFSRTILTHQVLRDSGVTTPMKALALEFHHVLRPDELFDMTVTVTAIHNRTFAFSVEAVGIDGVRRFSAVGTPIFVHENAFTSVEIPPEIRAALEKYQRSCALL